MNVVEGCEYTSMCYLILPPAQYPNHNSIFFLLDLLSKLQDIYLHICMCEISLKCLEI